MSIEKSEIALRLPRDRIVETRIYRDPEIFEREMTHIFGRVWIFVCHESEIPNPGDYRRAEVARQPLLICRGRDREIRAFYNCCRHRGALVKRERVGNCTAFTCDYHKWTYDLDGRLLGVPGIDAYQYEGCRFRKEDYGLVPVRTESIYGLVFVCLDPETESLRDYLGDVVPYMKSVLAHGAELELIHYHDFILKANWKVRTDNSRDMYHALYLHEFNASATIPEFDRKTIKVLKNGHAVNYEALEVDYSKLGDADPDWKRYAFPGQSDNEKMTLITIFPDLVLLRRIGALQIGHIFSLEASKTLVEVRGLGVKGESEDVREVRRKQFYLYWGPTGRNWPEDHEMLEAVQEGIQARGVPYCIIARGEDDEEGSTLDDLPLRAFYKEWRRRIGWEQVGE